jgi:hypothetical protein
MPTPTYWRNLALKAAVDNPAENMVYAVFIEFVMKHKVPPQRFVVHPLLSLAWKTYVEGEVLNIGVANFTPPDTNPPLKLRFGVEAKRPIEVMESLPPAASLITHPSVVTAFHHLSFQARDQAKAAIKNGYPIAQNGDTVQWILLIGPYWTPVTFGPFTDAELTVGALNPTPLAALIGKRQ